MYYHSFMKIQGHSVIFHIQLLLDHQLFAIYKEWALCSPTLLFIQLEKKNIVQLMIRTMGKLALSHFGKVSTLVVMICVTNLILKEIYQRQTYPSKLLYQTEYLFQQINQRQRIKLILSVIFAKVLRFQYKVSTRKSQEN